MTALIVICAAAGVLSLITFCVYGADKRAAVKGARRVPERVLLCLSFFGGAAGGICGMLLFRHKTAKFYFAAVNAAGAVWQAAAIVCAAIYLP